MCLSMVIFQIHQEVSENKKIYFFALNITNSNNIKNSRKPTFSIYNLNFCINLFLVYIFFSLCHYFSRIWEFPLQLFCGNVSSIVILFPQTSTVRTSEVEDAITYFWNLPFCYSSIKSIRFYGSFLPLNKTKLLRMYPAKNQRLQIWNSRNFCCIIL